MIQRGREKENVKTDSKFNYRDYFFNWLYIDYFFNWLYIKDMSLFNDIETNATYI